MVTTRQRIDTPSELEVVEELAGRGIGRPRSSEADEQIIDATLELLAEGGLAAASIEAVAARAGVAKTTVYRRYASASEMVAAAAGALALDAAPVPRHGSLRGDLEAIVGDIARALRDDSTRRVLAALVAGASRDDDLRTALMRHVVLPWRMSMAGVLEHAERDGELRRGLDRELAFDLLVGPAMHRALVTGGSLATDWRRSHVDLVMAAIAQPTAG